MNQIILLISFLIFIWLFFNAEKFKKINVTFAPIKNCPEFVDKYKIKINDDNKKSFYLEASTLLSAIKDSFKSDPNISLAIEEENLLSHTDLEADSA